MKIQSVRLYCSAVSIGKLPSDGLPEYAFLGRSNCGKSSLINAITQRKRMARASGTPGKTQLLNYFFINESWYLVDLPGYGWARAPKTQRQSLTYMIETYLQKRKDLTTAFVLIDSRHVLLPIDHYLIEKLGENNIPFSIILTKADKLKKGVLEKNYRSFREKLLLSWEELPPIFISSSLKKQGLEEIRNYIEKVNKSLTQK